jgi:putative transport protein
MSWFIALFTQPSIAQTIVILSIVIAAGIWIGHFRVAGVNLGIAGVLFAGLAAGHVVRGLDHDILHLVRELGLVVFVYTIGIQVGPAFFAAFRKDGVWLNAAAAGIVLLGVACAAIIHWIWAVPIDQLAGILAGATTNTPSLAAAQQTLKGLPGIAGDGAMSTMGYAMAYPFGIVGIILTMLAVRFAFRVNVPAEAEQDQARRAGDRKLRNANLVVKNPGLAGVAIEGFLGMAGVGAVVSRLSRRGQVSVPARTTALEVGDVLHAVGAPEELNKLRIAAGDAAGVDLRAVPSKLAARRIVVTRKDAVGTPVSDIQEDEFAGVAITRIDRAGTEFVPSPGVKLQFADVLVAVGEETALNRLILTLGNSPSQLEEPNIAPIFIGIVVGVIVGSIPITLPGLSTPVKLGLAGGPLLVAILLSRLGYVGPFNWYLPNTANLAIREIGISAFLACVGLLSGERFFEPLMSGEGWRWIGYGAIITAVPLVAVGAALRGFARMNYVTICGILAGAMTDPPALAFAGQLTQSPGASVSYATVYPLTMFLRVLTIQVFILIVT